MFIVSIVVIISVIDIITVFTDAGAPHRLQHRGHVRRGSCVAIARRSCIAEATISIAATSASCIRSFVSSSPLPLSSPCCRLGALLAWPSPCFSLPFLPFALSLARWPFRPVRDHAGQQQAPAPAAGGRGPPGCALALGPAAASEADARRVSGARGSQRSAGRQAAASGEGAADPVDGRRGGASGVSGAADEGGAGAGGIGGSGGAARVGIVGGCEAQVARFLPSTGLSVTHVCRAGHRNRRSGPGEWPPSWLSVAGTPGACCG